MNIFFIRIESNQIDYYRTAIVETANNPNALKKMNKDVAKKKHGRNNNQEGMYFETSHTMNFWTAKKMLCRTKNENFFSPMNAPSPSFKCKWRHLSSAWLCDMFHLYSLIRRIVSLISYIWKPWKKFFWTTYLLMYRVNKFIQIGDTIERAVLVYSNDK